MGASGLLSLDEIMFEEEPHRYTYRGQVYVSVTQAIRLAGLGEDFSYVNPERLLYAQRRGSMVHLATHYFDDGGLDLKSVDDSIRGYVDAYIAFRSDRPLKVIASERRMISEKLKVATTPDLICFMGGQRCVIEKKTSQSIAKSARLQTAGQKLIWNDNHPAEPIRERYGLRLAKTGKYKLEPHEDYEDEIAFLQTLEHAQSEKRMGRWREKYGK